MPKNYLQSVSFSKRIKSIFRLMYIGLNNKYSAKNELFCNIKILKNILRNSNILVMPYLELVVTTKCSLRCKYCANLMPLYLKEQHITYSIDELKKNLNRLLESVDYIEWFRLIGGEPLVYKDLPELLEYCISLPQLGRIEIVTNGTIVPEGRLLDIMSSDSRVSFDFSNYGTISKNILPCISATKKASIPFTMQTSYTWEDMGSIKGYNYTSQALKNVYSSCDNICKTLVGKNLYVCPRAAHGTILGLVKEIQSDFVNIFASDIHTTRNKIIALFNVSSIEACQICKPQNSRETIPAGEQI